MGTIWLLSLPDVLRGAGLRVVEHPGWETRARSSGGYDAVLAVQVHHTASKTTPENDQAYMWHNADSEPIGACYLGRDGVWTVGCAGATNTSGSGGPLGAIPLDAANRYVISVEAANDGVGEPWPWAQTDSYLTGVTALCAAYGLSTWYPDVHSHKEWTSRKIDPAGPSPWAQGSASWNMDAFRADLGGTVPPPPHTGDDLMYTFLDLTDVDAVLGGYMDANGICAVAEWLTPARYAAMASLGAPTVEIPSDWCINITLLGAVPDGMTPGHFANVIP